jgi:hypothetical protein
VADRRPKLLLLVIIESGGSEPLRIELQKVYLQRHVTWAQMLTAVYDTEHFMCSTLAKFNILVNSLKETK